jgi:sigma-E factor negative regulatory protein RseA
MTQEISSLMDGELEPNAAGQAIGACCASEEHRSTWTLYHAIGDAMRGQPPGSLARPSALFARLKDQPTVLAPRKPMQTTVARIAMAAAASIATVGVVGWIGSQGNGGGDAISPLVAKSASSIQPVANTAIVPQAPALDVQDYLLAHRQMPSPELYRQVTNRTPAVAR